MKRILLILGLVATAAAYGQEPQEAEGRFQDAKGYVYRMDGAAKCYLAKGGEYEGVIELPEKVVNPDTGKKVEVAGIDTDAFIDSRMVTAVRLANKKQRVSPGAFSFSSIPYDWSAIEKPFYCYPNAAKTTFVIPMEKGAAFTEPETPWVIFKQNITPARLSGDTRGMEDLMCGRADWDFTRTQGLFFDLVEPKKATDKLFRGYDSIEIEALVAGRDFVAFHTFPSYGRWKYPEPEKEAPAAIVKALAKKFHRTVKSSARVAWLRDGTGELDMVEFEIKGGEAMVAFAWVGNGEIYATWSDSTKVDPQYPDSSVWNVDDDGDYGIPDVVTIAIDPEGYANIFIAKNAPESITCFILHQVGDHFERIDLDQWYRFLG